MKRLGSLLLSALAPLGLAACNFAYSTEPLLSAGAAAPKEGLWAALEEGCAPPGGTDVARWPRCAEPVWVGRHQAAFAGEKPVPFLLADGPPPMLQVGPIHADAEEGRPGGAYFYYGVARPEGPAPYARARVWTVVCPREEAADIKEVERDDDGCRTMTPGALRTLAESTMRAEPGQLMIWIAPADKVPADPRSS